MHCSVNKPHGYLFVCKCNYYWSDLNLNLSGAFFFFNSKSFANTNQPLQTWYMHMLPSESCELRGVWRNIINLSRIKPIKFYVFVLSMPIISIHWNDTSDTKNETDQRITHHIYIECWCFVSLLTYNVTSAQNCNRAILNYDCSNKFNIINFYGTTPTESLRFHGLKMSFGFFGLLRVVSFFMICFQWIACW